MGGREPGNPGTWRQELPEPGSSGGRGNREAWEAGKLDPSAHRASCGLSASWGAGSGAGSGCRLVGSQASCVRCASPGVLRAL